MVLGGEWERGEELDEQVPCSDEGSLDFGPWEAAGPGVLDLFGDPDSVGDCFRFEPDDGPGSRLPEWAPGCSLLDHGECQEWVPGVDEVPVQDNVLATSTHDSFCKF